MIGKNNVANLSIEHKIYLLRGQKVMLDRDLAELYQVPTKIMNQAVRRNQERFPEEFMFQLIEKEYLSLRSQIVTLEKGRGKYSKYMPFAFTEHGVVMLSAVLKSERAIYMSIQVVNAFVRMREMIARDKDLANRISKIEAKQDRTSSIIEVLVDEIDSIAAEVKDMKKLPEPPKRKIGFDL